MLRKWAESLATGDGERGRITYYFVFLTLVGAGLAIGRASADALFLAHVGIARLPYAYAWLAAALGVAGLGYASAAARLSADRLFLALLIACAGLVAATSAALAQTSAAAVYYTYFVTSAVAAELLFLHAAHYLSRNLDPAKWMRVSLPALAALPAGGIPGGAFVVWSAARGQTAVLPMVWAGLLVAAAALLAVHHYRGGRSPFARGTLRRPVALGAVLRRVAHGVGFLNASPLVRASSIALFFGSAASFVLFFAVNRVYVEHFTSDTDLAMLFGAIACATGLLGLLVGGLATGRLLARRGVRVAGLVYPAALVAALGGLALWFALPLAFFGSFVRETLLPAVRRPARAMTLNALPPGRDAQVRALQVAIILPAGLLGASALLLVTAPVAGPHAMLIAGSGVAGAALWWERRVIRAYVESLLATLRERLTLPNHHTELLAHGAGPEVIEALARGVRHADDAVCVVYARQLAAVNPARAGEEIVPRLRSARAAVRDRLLRLLLDARAVTGAQLLQALAGADEHLRATILNALFDARNETARDYVEGCLRAPNPRLVATGIYGVFRYGLRVREKDAFTLWTRMLGSRQASDVLAGLELLTRFPHPVLQTRLWPLLEHRSARVRAVTLEALAKLPAGVLPDPSPVLERLAVADDPAIRRACVRVMHLMPPEAMWPRLFGALGDESIEVREEAERIVLAEGRRSVGRLAEWLSQVSIPVRAQLGAARVLMKLRPARVTALGLAQAKLDYALMLARAREVLAPHAGRGRHGLLLRVLDERIAGYANLCLELMRGATDAHVISLASAAIAGGAGEDIRAAQAWVRRRVEPRVLARRFCVLLDGRAGAPIADIDDRNIGRPRAAGEALAWLAEQPDAWLRACAREAQRESSVTEA